MRAYADRDPRYGIRLVSDPVPVRLPKTIDLVEVGLEAADLIPAGLVAWAGRLSNGFAVQGLVDAEKQCYITCAIPGQGLYQTFEVSREDAQDAFEHPFAYGCTLPL